MTEAEKEALWAWWKTADPVETFERYCVAARARAELARRCDEVNADPHTDDDAPPDWRDR